MSLYVFTGAVQTVRRARFLPGSARGQSAAGCGKYSVQLWQSERYYTYFFEISFAVRTKYDRNNRYKSIGNDRIFKWQKRCIKQSWHRCISQHFLPTADNAVYKKNRIVIDRYKYRSLFQMSLNDKSAGDAPFPAFKYLHVFFGQI